MVKDDDGPWAATRTEAAFHEAGHAVVHVALGGTIRWSKLCVQYEGRGPDWEAWTGETHTDDATPWIEGVTIVAGHTAECRVRNVRPNLAAYEPDEWNRAIGYAKKTNTSPDLLVNMAEILVDTLWNVVSHFAKELMSAECPHDSSPHGDRYRLDGRHATGVIREQFRLLPAVRSP